MEALLSANRIAVPRNACPTKCTSKRAAQAMQMKSRVVRAHASRYGSLQQAVVQDLCQLQCTQPASPHTLYHTHTPHVIHSEGKSLWTPQSERKYVLLCR